MSYNGGKDCTVLLDLALKAMPSNVCIPVVYVRPEDHIPELEQFAQNTCMSNPRLRLYEYSGCSLKEGLGMFIRETSVGGVLVGLRGSDPFGGLVKPLIPTDNGWPAFIRIHPMLDWSYHDVWTYLKINNIPYCSLYDEGYTSLGARHNTVRNPELLRPDGTYRPASELADPTLERASRQ